MYQRDQPKGAILLKNARIVTMKGDAVSMDAADKMKKRLSYFLKEVTLSDIKPSADGRIFFTVIANTLK